MIRKEILEGNKLILDFMSITPKQYGDVWSWADAPLYFTHEKTYDKVMENIVEYVKYNTSWDWLMPVVDRIEKLLYFFSSAPFIDDETNTLSGEYFCTIQYLAPRNLNMPYFIEITGCSSKIEAVYKAVVEFIKQINKTVFSS
jgi:hypothetical protein